MLIGYNLTIHSSVIEHWGIAPAHGRVRNFHTDKVSTLGGMIIGWIRGAFCRGLSGVLEAP